MTEAGFSIPGCDGTFFVGDPHGFRDVPRGRIFTASEVDLLKRAALTPEERRVVAEVKLVFSGEIVRFGEPTRAQPSVERRPEKPRPIVPKPKKAQDGGQLSWIEGLGPAGRLAKKK